MLYITVIPDDGGLRRSTTVCFGLRWLDEGFHSTFVQFNAEGIQPIIVNCDVVCIYVLCCKCIYIVYYIYTYDRTQGQYRIVN